MENRKEEGASTLTPAATLPHRSAFRFRSSIFLASACLALAHCGSPGDPVPPRIPVPVAVTDLAARQEGERVVLTCTLPAKTTEGDALEQLPDVEIFRDADLPPSPPPAKSAARPAASHIYTVPSALVETYLRDGRFVFSDPFKPADWANFSGRTLTYRVQTRVSKRKASESSNPVSLRVQPAAAATSDLAATLTATAVELRWTPPLRLVTGAQIPALAGYRIYRAETGAGESAVAPPVLLGVSPVPQYRDAQFEFGRTYIYTVRSVAQFDVDTVESEDSNAVRIEARDAFAPAAPRNLVVVGVAGREGSPAAAELSWGISEETDVAGYNVYRSEAGAAEGTLGAKINAELLLAPAFRDTSVSAGRGYTYRVTAVDRAGNESPASPPAAVTVPN